MCQRSGLRATSFGFANRPGTSTGCSGTPILPRISTCSQPAARRSGGWSASVIACDRIPRAWSGMQEPNRSWRPVTGAMGRTTPTRSPRSSRRFSRARCERYLGPPAQVTGQRLLGRRCSNQCAVVTRMSGCSRESGEPIGRRLRPSRHRGRRRPDRGGRRRGGGRRACAVALLTMGRRLRWVATKGEDVR